MFETLSKGFRSARNLLSGVGELNEENLRAPIREVKRALLEADVELSVVRDFLARVESAVLGTTFDQRLKAKGQSLKISASDRFIYACQHELEALMAYEGEALELKPKPQISSIMLVGLQGAGKTTTAGKLANYLREEHGRKPLLVGADVQRPGAIDQLQTLGGRLDVPVFSIPGGIPEEICAKAEREARLQQCDTIIYDTAGRLAIDDALMEELSRIKARVEPGNILYVVDAMIGQDAVRTAERFHTRLDLDGVVLTKLDGDARGGAALSIRVATGAPVKFVGLGEDLGRLELFRAEGMASRILGFGDVVGLMKDFEGVIDEEKAQEDAARMLQGDFSFDDFLEQISMIQKMGPLQDMLEKLPFFADSVPEGFTFDERELGRATAMVRSMTAKERKAPELFQQAPSRLTRVARGSGQPAEKVAQLIQNFAQMRTLFGSIGQQAGMMAKVPGLKQLASANRLREVVRAGGGLEQNPMMANLAESLLEAAVAEHPGGLGGFGARTPSPAKKLMQGAALQAGRGKRRNQRKQQRKARKKAR